MSWLRMLLGTVVLVALCVVASPPALLAYQFEVRSGPDMSYDVVATIPPGSYMVVAQEQAWYKLRLADGREGWIARAMVRAAPSARVAPVAITLPAMPYHTAPAIAPAIPPRAQIASATSDRKPAMVSTARRTALVIGNAAYRMDHLGPLRNAGKDALDMAARLRQLAFDVTLLQDVSLAAMEDAVNAFNRQLRQGGVGLFYFAGHGIQVEGENYLIPLNVQIERQQDVRYQALPVGRVLGAMEDAGNGLNVLILDACRNTPFTRSWRSSQAGLAAPPPARGTLIAYATAPGGVAVDGEGDNGVYTKHLLQAMTVPGLSIEHVFKQVRSGVVTETHGKQIPWESSSLLGDFTFLPAQAGTVSAAASPPMTHVDPETQMWNMAERSSHPEDVLAFLATYPASRFAPVARLRLQQLQRQHHASDSGLVLPSAGPVPPGGAAVFPPLLSPGAVSRQSVDRAALPQVLEDHGREGQGRQDLTDQQAPDRVFGSYTLIRRIYCEDISSGVIASSIDLIATSPLSCAEAKQVLLGMEQETDNCRYPKGDKRFVDDQAQESRYKAKEWIGTQSCPGHS